LQLVNGLVLVTTFGCSRLLWGTYQSVCMYADLWKAWNYVGVGGAGGMAGAVGVGGVDVDVARLPAWLAVVFAGGNAVLCALNYYWFGKMVRAVAKRFAPEREGEGEVAVGEKETLEELGDEEVPPPLS